MKYRSVFCGAIVMSLAGSPLTVLSADPLSPRSEMKEPSVQDQHERAKPLPPPQDLVPPPDPEPEPMDPERGSDQFGNIFPQPMEPGVPSPPMPQPMEPGLPPPPSPQPGQPLGPPQSGESEV